ncbi:MAG: [Fe-Fe] hydrogenase large subunit C-terminal domain-containing protein [Candidatus Spyradocola sp.]
MEQATTYYHSVMLEREKCKGCTTCLKHCPTEAIRVYGGSAHIIRERCIDCGACIQRCPYHAKVAVTDPLSKIQDYKIKVALPAPTLYGQFKGLKDISRLLDALIAIGFDDVYEVARGAEYVSREIAGRVANRKVHNGMPLISSACPAIVRLIQVRFPELLDNVVDVISPMEAAALAARKRVCRNMSADPADVGIFFLTPCPAKMTEVRAPQAIKKSNVDGVLSIMDVYGKLNAELKTARHFENLQHAGAYGVGWAQTGGEMLAVGVENSLAVDGIENVIQVLESIENGDLADLDYFEGLACVGGCLGGPLTFENTYVAKNRLRKLTERLPKRTAPAQEAEEAQELTSEEMRTQMLFQPNPAMKLDDDFAVALRKMEQIERVLADLPGLDCGSCGSPTCRALAEDVVLGYAVELDCIFKLKQKIQQMSKQMVDMAQMTRR